MQPAGSAAHGVRSQHLERTRAPPASRRSRRTPCGRRSSSSSVNGLGIEGHVSSPPSRCGRHPRRDPLAKRQMRRRRGCRRCRRNDTRGTSAACRNEANKRAKDGLNLYRRDVVAAEPADEVVGGHAHARLLQGRVHVGEHRAFRAERHVLLQHGHGLRVAERGGQDEPLGRGRR